MLVGNIHTLTYRKGLDMQTTVHAINLALEHCADSVKNNAGVISLAGEFDTLIADLGDYLIDQIGASCPDGYYLDHLADDIAEALANVDVADVYKDTIEVCEYGQLYFDNAEYCNNIIARYGDAYNFHDNAPDPNDVQEYVEAIVNTVIYHNYVAMVACVNATY